MWENRSSSFSDKRIFLLAFLFINLFLSSFYIDIWCTPNPVSRALPVLALLEDGTLKIDKYQNMAADKSKVGDHYYSDKAPLPTLAAVPFYWLMQKAELTKTNEQTGKKYPVYIWSPVSQDDGRNSMVPEFIPLLFMGSLLFGSVPFAVMILLALKKIQGAAGFLSPVLLVMMSFYGSFMFVFAGTYFGHIIAAFLLLLGYILIKDEKYFWSGLCVGLAFLSEYTVALAMPLWALVIWLKERNVKKPLLYGLGALPGVVFIMAYNYFINGHPFQSPYAYHDAEVFRKQMSSNYGFSLPSLSGLWGLSFSFYMGLLPHVPVLLFCGYFVVQEMLNKYSFRKLLHNYLAMFSIPFFLLISSFFTWWGGWSYGPRYLICLAAILVYEGIIYLSGKKVNVFLFVGITGFGLICTWLAKVTIMYMVPDATTIMDGPAPGGDSFENFILPHFISGHFNANNIFTLGLDVSPEAAAYLWLVFFIAATAGFSAWYKELYPLQEVKVKAKLKGRSKKRKKRLVPE